MNFAALHFLQRFGEELTGFCYVGSRRSAAAAGACASEAGAADTRLTIPDLQINYVSLPVCSPGASSLVFISGWADEVVERRPAPC